ncbi:quinone oxidoreductase family protein [Cellulomonas chengniuliangii]|uniref:Zinc-binding alcohol dehydrogenase family protein n=1 Tax=Cellulomonas chengniuliangii TaxID=2968084 RepID=A0ABY5L5M4_9CELL|nr:zinc-binding alcohol dehydrogenase family protein [Cellulomonas chengniuliangii]MCC2307317.1 zinc-binding alcohol dehydrogenase family protein [Cellulomonas chengniuliangii]UUI75893.1 zinc-binding alcohol dehydrogenase family protein [Cellulomonas chengniuliangii]
MRAAVVTEFDHPPQCLDVPEPTPGDHQEIVDVLAVGLHPRVRSQANGSHYTSAGVLPVIPGVDGVGRRADGSLVYFVLPPGATQGSMAELATVDTRSSVTLPDDADPVRVAAAMNPAMSSWLALRRRVGFTPGEHVLVLGATGSAGQLAVQVARALGARSVTAVGRGTERLAFLPDLGADVVVSLDGDPDEAAQAVGRAASEVDVVLDYLWGAPTQAAIGPVLAHRADPARRLDWIEIGSVAGPQIALPAAALRAVNLRLLGSGHGSVSTDAMVAELGELARWIVAGTFTQAVLTFDLADIEQAWAAPVPAGARVVVTPTR